MIDALIAPESAPNIRSTARLSNSSYSNVLIIPSGIFDPFHAAEGVVGIVRREVARPATRIAGSSRIGNGQQVADSVVSSHKRFAQRIGLLDHAVGRIELHCRTEFRVISIAATTIDNCDGVAVTVIDKMSRLVFGIGDAGVAIQSIVGELGDEAANVGTSFEIAVGKVSLRSRGRTVVVDRFESVSQVVRVGRDKRVRRFRCGDRLHAVASGVVIDLLHMPFGIGDLGGQVEDVVRERGHEVVGAIVVLSPLGQQVERVVLKLDHFDGWPRFANNSAATIEGSIDVGTTGKNHIFGTASGVEDRDRDSAQFIVAVGELIELVVDLSGKVTARVLSHTIGEIGASRDIVVRSPNEPRS